MSGIEKLQRALPVFSAISSAAGTVAIFAALVAMSEKATLTVILCVMPAAFLVSLPSVAIALLAIVRAADIAGRNYIKVK